MFASFQNWKKLLLCFVMGGILVGAFAPFNLYFLGFISLATLFYLWRDSSPKLSFWLGLSFGYGLYGVGVSWVYVSLSTYGGMPLWMGIISVLGFTGLLALLIGLSGYVIARFFSNYRAIAIPCVWIVFEWVKSWLFTGFPWLDVGYTQTSSWLISWAPVGGIYLVSFVVVTIASCLAVMAQKYSSLRLPRLKQAACVLVLLCISYGLTFHDWSYPVGKPLSVGVVQPNTPIDLKWQHNYQSELISKLARLSHGLNNTPQNKLSNTPVDLIVWPETALPLYSQQTDEAFWSSITPKGSALLTGIMDSPNRNDQHEIYNAAALSCDGQQPAIYRKTHLVPFGEYLPLRFLFNWVLEYLQLPMSDLSSWKGNQSLNCGETLKIGLSICYEDAFAAEYRSNVGDATLLVNISEDAWFGDSFAPHQRQQMAQMRAAELARPLVRSANSGPSLLIDHKGDVLVTTPQFSVQAIQFMVQPHDGDTPFKRFGNWIIWLSFAGLMLLIMFNRRVENSQKTA